MLLISKEVSRYERSVEQDEGKLNIDLLDYLLYFIKVFFMVITLGYASSAMQAIVSEIKRHTDPSGQSAFVQRRFVQHQPKRSIAAGKKVKSTNRHYLKSLRCHFCN